MFYQVSAISATGTTAFEQYIQFVTINKATPHTDKRFLLNCPIEFGDYTAISTDYSLLLYRLSIVSLSLDS